MKSAAELEKNLMSINRRSYPAYKDLRGSYQFQGYQLNIDHVQGDPFASPKVPNPFFPHFGFLLEFCCIFQYMLISV